MVIRTTARGGSDASWPPALCCRSHQGLLCKAYLLFERGLSGVRTGIIDGMSMTISALARCAVPVVVALAGSTAPAAAETGTVVPMRSILRACDFTPIPDRASTDRGTASAVIHVNGGSVTAEVHLAESGQPGTHYDVSLIQLPRASNAPCDVPGPGVAVAGLDSDGAGNATTTVRDGLRSGTTGVWVFIRRASAISQSPAEFY